MLSTPKRFEWGKYSGPVTGQVKQVLINCHRRAVRCLGFVGARVQGKTLTGSSHHVGMGDCVFLDFSRSFFAIADASDRNTAASRTFILKFAQMLEEKELLNVDHIYTSEEVLLLKQQLTAESGKLLTSLLPFKAGCTFTGVALLQTTHGMTSIVMHTGDSLLFQFDLNAFLSRQLTKTNAWMVGKIQHLFQTEIIPISADTRLLLTSDGYYCISIPPETVREDFFLGMFAKHSADELPDLLIKEEDICQDGMDDTTIITVNPAAITRLPESIIIGGTTGREEKKYQEEKNSGLFIDEYIPAVERSELSNKEIIFLP